MGTNKKCRFDGCDRAVRVKSVGLCGGHYQQHHNGKQLQPLTVKRKKGSAGGPCQVAGCNKPDKSFGLCQAHYLRQRSGQQVNTRLKRTTEEVLEEIVRGVRTCIATTGCGRTLPLDQFHICKRNVSGRNLWCRDCSRNKGIEKRYGLTAEAWNAMFERQGHSCAICHVETPNGRSWMVDHDHACCPGQKTCGKCVRAILCHPCNITVGYLERHPDIQKVLEYIG